MKHIPTVFLSFQNVLGQWAWVFILIIAAAVVLIIKNRNVIKDVLTAEKPRFHINDSREFEHAFSENDAVQKMMADGESNFVNCAHCKRLSNCKKCSESDYDIAETVCGEFEL